MQFNIHTFVISKKELCVCITKPLEVKEKRKKKKNYVIEELNQKYNRKLL